MNILMLNRADALEHRGGDTVQMLRTRDELVKRGHRVEVATEADPACVGYDLAHVFNIQTSGHGLRQVMACRRHGLPVALSTIYWDLRPLDRDPDFVRLCGSPKLRALARRNAPLAIGLRSLYRKIRYDLRGRLPANLDQARRMMELAGILLPNSVAEAEVIALLLDAPWVRAKSMVIPNAVDPSLPVPVDVEVDLPGACVMEVAAIHPVKGQLKVIRALAGRTDLPVAFVGRANPDYLRLCRAEAAGCPHIRFVGEVPHAHIPAYLARARVHVLPSLRESPGLSSLEAALYGARCVVSWNGPALEYFGPDAFYCDPMDPASIRDAILAAWSAPGGDALRRRILERFTWAEAARLTEEAYHRLLARRGAGPS